MGSVTAITKESSTGRCHLAPPFLLTLARTRRIVFGNREEVVMLVDTGREIIGWALALGVVIITVVSVEAYRHARRAKTKPRTWTGREPMI